MRRPCEQSAFQFNQRGFEVSAQATSTLTNDAIMYLVLSIVMTFGLLNLENLNGKVRKDFLINCVLTLQQQFGEGSYMYVMLMSPWPYTLQIGLFL